VFSPVEEGGEEILKVENAVTQPVAASPLGTHQFLDEFALSYHHAVAERLRREGVTVVNHARQNLDRWMKSGEFRSGSMHTLEEWLKILDESDIDKLIEIITGTSDEGQRLRSSSPFVGTLTHEKRLEILAACEQRAVA
jgi:hypothetical protein